MRNQLSDQEVIAHHEAAHAVVAIELGLGILDIGIDLDRVEKTGGIGVDGCCLFVADLTDLEPKELEAEQMRLAGQIDCNGTVLAAGAASDAKLRNVEPRQALHQQPADYRLMKELLQKARIAPTAEDEEEHLRRQLALAVEALNDPPVWRSVQAVAEAVLRRGPLTGAEIETIAARRLEPNL